jgi:hypothetical protein
LTLLALLPSFGLVACTGEEDPPPSTAAPAGNAVPADLVSASWQVRMANNQARSSFEGRPSWVAWFNGRRDEALVAFKSESDSAGLARAHADYAALYRQGALLAANATLQVYGADRQPSDPGEVDYLLGVSGALTNDAESSKKLGNSGKSRVASIAAGDAAWVAFLAAPSPEGPDGPGGLAAIAGEMGTLPGRELAVVPLPLTGEPGTVDSGDPGLLWGLSRWHEARAREADPSAGGIIDEVLDPFRLPMEPVVERTSAPATDTWLFMSPYTSAADLQYVANAARGKDTTDAMAGASLYAALVKSCTRAGEGLPPENLPADTPPADNLDVDCMVDAAAAAGKAIEEAMATVNAGQVDSFHRPFADYARAGALRAADLVARARGQSENSGRLRINAFDRSIGNAADPVFSLFLAAWDAGNRNTPRAAEIVHQLLPSAPGLQVARAPLDALHIRLSRNAVPGVPMH